MAGLAAAALLLLGPRAAWASLPDAHEAPVPYVGGPGEAEGSGRRALLAELWRRRLLPPQTDTYSPEDLARLERLRRAERAGAIPYLRRRLGGLEGLAVSYRAPGAAYSSPRLTQEGHARYLFLRSQEALRYFESKGADAKRAFRLTDLEGRDLFDAKGLLTERGEALFADAEAKRPAFWKGPSGERYGTRRPPQEAPPPAAPAPARRPPVRPPRRPAGTVAPPTPAGVAVSTRPAPGQEAP